MTSHVLVIFNSCSIYYPVSLSQVGNPENWEPCSMSSPQAPQKPTAPWTHQYPWFFNFQVPRHKARSVTPHSVVVQLAHTGTSPATRLTWTSLWTRDMSTFVLSSRFPWKEEGIRPSHSLEEHTLSLLTHLSVFWILDTGSLCACHCWCVRLFRLIQMTEQQLYVCLWNCVCP